MFSFSAYNKWLLKGKSYEDEEQDISGNNPMYDVLMCVWCLWTDYSTT